MEVINVPCPNGVKSFYVHDGFIYNINKKSLNKLYLKCSVNYCGALGIANERDHHIIFEKCTSGHSHDKSYEMIHTEKFRRMAYSRAEMETTPYREIYDDVLRRYPLSTVTFPSARLCMDRSRKSRQPRNSPNTVDEVRAMLEMVPMYTVDLQNRPFYLASVTVGLATSSVIFVSNSLQHLLNVEGGEMFVDSTFSVVPNIFTQMMTIHFLSSNYVFPVVYVLMSGKATADYRRVFSRLKEEYIYFKPSSVMTDYELALKKALEEEFPNCMRSGCYFHFCQAVVRKSKYLRLQALSTNENFRYVLQMFLALPLLPARLIERAYNMIVERNIEQLNQQLDNNERQKVHKLSLYIKNQWINVVTPEVFSVFNLRHRTNNSVESFYNQCRETFKTPNPGIYKFIETLQAIEFRYSKEYLNALNGRPVRMTNLTKRRKRQNALDKEWSDLPEDPTNSRLSDFLKLMGHFYSENIVLDLERVRGIQFDNDPAPGPQPPFVPADNDPAPGPQPSVVPANNNPAPGPQLSLVSAGNDSAPGPQPPVILADNDPAPGPQPPVPENNDPEPGPQLPVVSAGNDPAPGPQPRVFLVDDEHIGLDHEPVRNISHYQPENEPVVGSGEGRISETAESPAALTETVRSPGETIVSSTEHGSPPVVSRETHGCPFSGVSHEVEVNIPLDIQNHETTLGIQDNQLYVESAWSEESRLPVETTINSIDSTETCGLSVAGPQIAFRETDGGSFSGTEPIDPQEVYAPLQIQMTHYNRRRQRQKHKRDNQRKNRLAQRRNGLARRAPQPLRYSVGSENLTENFLDPEPEPGPSGIAPTSSYTTVEITSSSDDEDILEVNRTAAVFPSYTGPASLFGTTMDLDHLPNLLDDSSDFLPDLLDEDMETEVPCHPATQREIECNTRLMTFVETFDSCCVICKENFKDGEDIRRLLCKHAYHPFCIEQWLLTTGKCPQCRRPI